MSSRIYISGNSESSAAFAALDWTAVRMVATIPQFLPGRLEQPPRTLHDWRVAFLNSKFDCRSVIITAYSKRHAKKLARKICRVKQWLKIERILS